MRGRGIMIDLGGDFVPPTPIVKPDFVLRPHQRLHRERVLEIIRKRPGYIDVSSMGTGKTYVFGSLSLEFNIPYVVICPDSSPWDKMAADHDFAGLYMGSYTYGTLISTFTSWGTRYLDNHGFLTRTDRPVTREDGTVMRKTTFEATQYWIDLCRKGIFLVVDEAQAIKTDVSLRAKAIQVLIEALIKAGDQSRFALLSATLFDKPSHAKSFVRAVGIVTSENKNMLEPDFAGGNNPTGFLQMYNWCVVIDKKATDEVISKYNGITGSNVDAIVYDLYINVIHQAMASEMPDRLPKRNFRGFFKMTRDEDRKAFNESVKRLQIISGWDESAGKFRKGGGPIDLGALVRILIDTEISLLYDMCRFHGEHLKANPKGKSVFFCVHRDDIVDAVEQYMNRLGYTCTKITGQVPPSQRPALRDNFLKYDTNRVMIMTLQVGAQSLNLKDDMGGHPILTTCTPNYHAILTHQSSGRSNRQGQFSLPYFYLFYPAEFMAGILQRILKNLAPKGEVIMSTRVDEETHGVTSEMPGNYPRFVENCGFVDEAALVQQGIDLSVDELLAKCSVGDPTMRNLAGIPFYDPMTKVPSLQEVSGFTDPESGYDELVKDVTKKYPGSDPVQVIRELEADMRRLKLVLRPASQAAGGVVQASQVGAVGTPPRQLAAAPATAPGRLSALPRLGLSAFPRPAQSVVPAAAPSLFGAPAPAPAPAAPNFMQLAQAAAAQTGTQSQFEMMGLPQPGPLSGAPPTDFSL